VQLLITSELTFYLVVSLATNWGESVGELFWIEALSIVSA